MKFFFALWLGKWVALAIKLVDPKRGSDFPGRLSYIIDKNFIKSFKNVNYNKVIFITGTNGKSTTTNLLFHTLRTAACSVIANLEGSNMLSGIATCLALGSDWRGRIKAEYIILEVDERSFPYIIEQLPGKNILITNIMQDQVHRNGDPDFIYQLLRKNLSKEVSLFLNNDEPRSKSFEDISEKIYYYGVDKNSSSYNKNGIYDVTMPCPYCFSKIYFMSMNSNNLGQFKCMNCGFSSSDHSLTLVENINFKEKTFTIRETSHPMPYGLPIMLYNYAGVSAICNSLGIKDEQISESFKSFINIEGRIETLEYRNKKIKYLRLKQGNPETIQTAIDSIALDEEPKIVALGMCIIPERRPKWVPHYTNTYYAYESNFKPLLSPNKMMIFSNYIAYDQVNRLIFDGFKEEDIKVVESEDPKVVLEAIYSLSSFGCDNIYLIAPIRNIKILKTFLKKTIRNRRSYER